MSDSQKNNHNHFVLLTVGFVFVFAVVMLLWKLPKTPQTPEIQSFMVKSDGKINLQGCSGSMGEPFIDYDSPTCITQFDIWGIIETIAYTGGGGCNGCAERVGWRSCYELRKKLIEKCEELCEQISCRMTKWETANDNEDPNCEPTSRGNRFYNAKVTCNWKIHCTCGSDDVATAGNSTVGIVDSGDITQVGDTTEISGGDFGNNGPQSTESARAVEGGY